MATENRLAGACARARVPTENVPDRCFHNTDKMQNILLHRVKHNCSTNCNCGVAGRVTRTGERERDWVMQNLFVKALHCSLLGTSSTLWLASFEEWLILNKNRIQYTIFFELLNNFIQSTSNDSEINSETSNHNLFYSTISPLANLNR